MREQIARGVLKPGDRLPSFSEMRDLYEAAPLTVDRMYALLEQDGLVVREPRRGVFVAQRVRQQTIGVIAPSGVEPGRQSDPFYMKVLGGIQQAAFAAEHEVLLLHHDAAIRWEKIDGLLLVGTSTAEFRKKLPPQLTGVSLLYPVDGMANVLADDFGGAEKATRHLIEQGHRRIACLSNPHHRLTQLRIAGYQSALREAGITPPAKWLHELKHSSVAGELREQGYFNMRHWIETTWRDLNCTALLTQNDWVAAGAMTALKEAGLRMPEDVSVVGFDSLSICDFMTPALSSIEVPLHEIGVAGVELLLRQMEKGEESDEKVVLPSRLHLRQSTTSPN